MFIKTEIGYVNSDFIEYLQDETFSLDGALYPRTRIHIVNDALVSKDCIVHKYVDDVIGEINAYNK